MGSKKRAAGPSKSKQSKKKKKLVESSDDEELPADPPSVPPSTERAGSETRAAPLANVATEVPQSSPRHPMITAGGKEASADIRRDDDRATRQFFILSDANFEMRRRIDQLQARIEALEKGAAVQPSKDAATAESFLLDLKNAANNMLPELVTSWFLGMDLRGVVSTEDKDCPPAFYTKLPFHYYFAALSTEPETREPLRKTLYAAISATETPERDAIFKKYFEHRGKKQEKGKGKDPTEYEGIFQMYQRLRRQDKNDKIGKPVKVYVDKLKIAPLQAPHHWRTLVPDGEEELPCFFFKVHGSREVFQDMFTAKHPQVEGDRTVLSVFQLAILDQTIDGKALGRWFKEEEKAAAVEKSGEVTGVRQKTLEDPASGQIRSPKKSSAKKESKVLGRTMAATAAGRMEDIVKCASSIARNIWENHHLVEIIRRTGKRSVDEVSAAGMTQPCDCCWVVDVQRPGSPVADMIRGFNDNQPKDAEEGVQRDEDGSDDSDGEE